MIELVVGVLRQCEQLFTLIIRAASRYFHASFIQTDFTPALRIFLNDYLAALNLKTHLPSSAASTAIANSASAAEVAAM